MKIASPNRFTVSTRAVLSPLRGTERLPYWIAALMLAAASRSSLGSVKPFSDIQLLVDQGNYRDAWSELDKIQKLNPTCDAAKQYDFADVGLLAADCQLHLGSAEKAKKAADKAITAADAADDQEKLAKATALYVLIDRSKQNKYTPRTGDSRMPIDILTTAAREQAMPFVLADELDAFRQINWKTKGTMKLDAEVAAAKHFAGVRAIEHLVTGNTEESDKLGLQASKDVDALVGNWIKDRNHDVDRIAKAAAVKVNTSQMGPRGMHTVAVDTGLGNNRQTLTNIVNNCDQMPDALQTISKGFGGSLQLDGIYRATDDLKQRIQGLFDKYPSN